MTGRTAMGTSRRAVAVVRPQWFFPLLALCGLVAMYWAMPVERTATLGLQFLFDGADRRQYPNGTPFTLEELISTPVLREVHQRHVGERAPFEAFARGFFISQSSVELERVHQYYRVRLDDSRLSPVDRSRLEAEYPARLGVAAGQPVALLGFRQPSDFPELSGKELEAVLADTAVVWAQSARDLKGALRYDLEVVGPDAVRTGSAEAPEFLVGVDGLRVSLVRVAATLEEMLKAPGFAGAQLASPPLTIDDLRTEVADLLELRVQPLVWQGVSAGYVRDGRSVASYYRSRHQQVGDQREAADVAVRAARQTLQDYVTPGGVPSGVGAGQGGGPAVIPQVNDAFLERLLQLSDASFDLQYRQRLADRVVRHAMRLARLQREEAYYDRVLALVGPMQKAPVRDDDAGFTRARGQLKAAEASAVTVARHVEALYEEVSRRSLDGQDLYRVVREFSVESRRSTSVVRGVVGALSALAGAFLLGWAIQWGLDRRGTRGRRRPDPPAAGAAQPAS